MSGFDLYGAAGKIFGGGASPELLELLGPEIQQRAAGQGLMGMATSLLKSSGWTDRPVTLGEAIGQGMEAGQAGYSSALQTGMGQFEFAQKIKEAKRKAALLAAQQAQQQQLAQFFNQDPMAGAQAAATQAAVNAPVEVAGRPGPTVQRAGIQQAALQSMSPAKMRAEQYRRAAQMVAASSPETATKYIEIADKLDPREEFYAPTEANGQFFQASKSGAIQGVNGFTPKPPAPPSEVQAYQFAVSQGYKGSFDQWDQARRRAGANSLTVHTGEKRFVDALAPAIAQQVAETGQNAAGAQASLATIQQIRAALPNAITGPGADARIFLAQLQNVLGIGGANDAERLANTRSVMQGLAQQELNAAQQMKGQGAITEPEREIIRRAASGTINMVPAEINALMTAIEKVANLKIRAHQRNLSNLRNVPGMDALLPFFGGLADGPGAPPASNPSSIQEAAQQEMLRRQQRGN